MPRLVEYIKIPNKSPMFDAKWAEHGYTDQAVALMEQWARAQPIQGMKLEVGATPGANAALISSTSPARETTACFSMASRQAARMTGCRNLGPWKPVLEGDRPYGRGAADDVTTSSDRSGDRRDCRRRGSRTRAAS